MRLHLDGRTRAGILDGRVRAVLRAGNGQEITSGMVVPVMPASGPAVFRVRVIEAEWLPIGDALPDGDVKRARDLGFRTSQDARRAWLTGCDRRLRRLEDSQLDALDEQDWQDAWARNHDRHVWLLRIGVEPSADVPRFLGRGTADRTALLDKYGARKRVSDGGDIARGYTTVPGAAVDDAECVSDADLARFRVVADEREIGQLEQRIAAATALLDGVLTERQLRVLTQQLEFAERQYQRSRSAA